MGWVSRIKDRLESHRNGSEAQKDDSMATPAAEDDIASRVEIRGIPYTGFDYMRDKFRYTLRLGPEPEVDRAARIRDEHRQREIDYKNSGR